MRVFLQCDDAYFVGHFSDYVSHKYTDIEFFCFYDRERAFEIFNTMKNSFTAIICEHDFAVQLPETRSKILFVSEYSSFAESSSMTINIYQSVPAIIADLKSALSLNKENINMSDTAIVTMFSVQGGSGKSTIAYALALAAARQNYKALYLNFEEFASEKQMHRHEYKGRIENLLFKLGESSDIAPILLDTLEIDENGVYILPPFYSIEDLLSLTSKNIEYLLSTLVQKCNAKYIFIDLPTGFHRLTLDFMEHATSVLQVYSDTVQGREKLEKVKNDNYYTSSIVSGKRITVLNMAEKPDSESGVDIKFPKSSSLKDGKMIAEVEERNPSYLNVCNQLLGMIN
jgi:CobQ/CobB/MinD/ParA nucleotide binding domain protein